MLLKQVTQQFSVDSKFLVKRENPNRIFNSPKTLKTSSVPELSPSFPQSCHRAAAELLVRVVLGPQIQPLHHRGQRVLRAGAVHPGGTEVCGEAQRRVSPGAAALAESEVISWRFVKKWCKG